MAGLCGVIGKEVNSPTVFGQTISFSSTERSSEYRNESLTVKYSDHAFDFAPQPGESRKDGAKVWCWGEIIGHDCRGSYERRTECNSDAEYCASLYDKFGSEFVAGLNSEFAGLIFRPDQKLVQLFTDRLSSRPVYYTNTPDGELVFATHIHALADHPEISLEFDPKYLLEFFHTTRVFGTNTPVKGVKQCPPGAIISVDLDGTIVETTSYWEPEIVESNKSFAQLTEEFQRIFRSAVQDRVPEDGEIGLLLSGGADSRLVLGELDASVTAFHLNERVAGNTEAETAKQIADAGDAQFAFLQRDLNYYPSVLRDSLDIMNFNGVFRHSHALGFREEIRDSCDVLFSGHYADTVVKGLYIPQQFKTSMIRHILPTLPVHSITNQSSFKTAFTEYGFYSEKVEYCCEGDGLPTINFDNSCKPNGIEMSDIKYMNSRLFTDFGMVYPITNTFGFNFYETNCQILPAKYPFLDNRIIEYSLKLPRSVRLKRDIVASALRRSHSSLAAIPHPKYGVSLQHSKPIRHFAGKTTRGVRKLRKKVLNEYNSDPDKWPGPWADHADLIREHPFITDILSDNQNQMELSSIIDSEAAFSTLQAHQNGENHTNTLYALAMVLSSSINLPKE